MDTAATRTRLNGTNSEITNVSNYHLHYRRREVYTNQYLITTRYQNIGQSARKYYILYFVRAITGYAFVKYNIIYYTYKLQTY